MISPSSSKPGPSPVSFQSNVTDSSHSYKEPSPSISLTHPIQNPEVLPPLEDIPAPPSTDSSLWKAASEFMTGVSICFVATCGDLAVNMGPVRAKTRLQLNLPLGFDSPTLLGKVRENYSGFNELLAFQTGSMSLSYLIEKNITSGLKNLVGISEETNYHPHREISQTERHIMIFSSMVSGGVSGAVFTPFESVMVHKQSLTGPQQPQSTAQLVRHMYKHGGIASFYGKASPLIAVREMSYASMVYGPRWVQSALFSKDFIEKNPLTSMSVASSICGTVCSIITNPLDVLKTTLQNDATLETFHDAARVALEKHRSVFRAASSGVIVRALSYSIGTTIFSYVEQKLKQNLDR